MAYLTEKEIIKEKSKNFWRRNRFEIQEFIINDRKKHPIAIICPGVGLGQGLVCEGWNDKAVEFWLD